MSRRCFLFSSSAMMCQRFSIIVSLFILIFVLSKVNLIVASNHRQSNEFLKLTDTQYLNDVQATTDQIRRKKEQPSTSPWPSEAMSGETNSKKSSRKNEEIQSNGFSIHRVRRQISENHDNQFFINIIIFADKTMSDHYGNELKDYIKLIMAKVSRMFKHFSIGNSIAFGSVNIETTNENFLDKNKYEFNTTMEKNFCQWQSTQRNNPEMRNLNNSHVALLLTRHHICLSSDGNKHCNAIGMAPLGTICNPNLSCTVVNDGPHSTASTIAHEIGHLLGMKHDGDDPNHTCIKNDNNRSLHLMNFQETMTHPLMWSNCSDEYLTQFLESGRGDCLLAKPREKFDETRYRHLGEQYSLNKTCEIAWGPGYYTTELNDDEKCGKFACRPENIKDGYILRWLKVSDGTTCGDNKICYEGECISTNKMRPVNGGWSDYGDFSECSRTCGGGIKIRYRYCNNPTPMYGGQYCLGKKKDYEICASNKCPGGSQDFRDSQCAEFNNQNLSSLGIENISFNWKSSEVADYPCVLYCKNENKDLYQLQNQVIDGTPCRGDNFHMCVRGVCKKYGCDYKLNSTAELDICNVCNGKNSTCHKITKSFTFIPTSDHQDLPSYHEIYKIPAGSHHIDIKQYTTNSSPTHNSYIALKLGNDRSNILNGNLDGSLKWFSSVYESSGINIEYSLINNSFMQVNIIKPIVDYIVVEVLFTRKFALTQTLLEFYIPSSSNRHDYRWTIGEWSRCNCQGIKNRDVKCQLTKENETVANSFCKTEQPKSSMECNSNCVLRWDIKSKTSCSTKCGRGTRNINYNCVQDFIQETISTVKKLDPIYCSHIKKPIESEECYTNCSANWNYSNWGECSVTCGGGGVRIRRAQCVDNTGRKVNENMCSLKKDLIESCGLNECPKWVTGPWSACSVSLGKGKKERQVTCQNGNTTIDDSFCIEPMPVNKKICNKGSSTDPNKKKINYYDKAIKLIQKMDSVINDLKNQRLKLKRILKNDERVLLEQQNQQINNSFVQFQKYSENAHNHGADYKTCDITINTTLKNDRDSAYHSLDNCFTTISKTLILKTNQINSEIKRGRQMYNHTSNLQKNCSENNIEISKKYCNSEKEFATESIEALRTSAKKFQDDTTEFLRTKNSCYNEATELFSQSVKNARKSFIFCHLH